MKLISDTNRCVNVENVWHVELVNEVIYFDFNNGKPVDELHFSRCKYAKEFFEKFVDWIEFSSNNVMITEGYWD